MDKQTPDVTWISHRGLCHNADENTLASFTAAVLAGFDYLETDLRASKDGHIVLSHDLLLSRTAKLAVNVSLSSRQQLSAITLNKGSPLLFLDEFFSSFDLLGHVFDIKPETGFAVIALLARYTSHIDLTKTIFLTWSRAQQDALLTLFPGANCFARENECKRAGFSILCKVPFFGGIRRGKTYSVPPYIYGRCLFEEKIVNYYRQYGAKVLAFLPNTRQQAQMAIEAKVAYVLSNDDFGMLSAPKTPEQAS